MHHYGLWYLHVCIVMQKERLGLKSVETNPELYMELSKAAQVPTCGTF